MSLSNQHIIEGIKKHCSEVLKGVYDSNFPMIEAYIRHNQGTADQARDVFQEAMIIVYRRIQADELELSCKFGTYLYAICKNIWMQERKKYLLRAEKLRQQEVLLVQEPEATEDFLLKDHMTNLFNKHFAELSPDCQKILSMYFNNYSVEDIRAEMKYKDLHHTADRKYRCKKSLIKRIINDPLFKRLKDELP